MTDICNEWFKNPLINPRSGNSIQYNKKTYNDLVDDCKKDPLINKSNPSLQSIDLVPINPSTSNFIPRPINPVLNPVSPIPRPINPIPRPIPRPINPVINPISPIPRPINPVINPISPIPRPIPRPINPTLNPISPIPRPINPIPRPINPVLNPISIPRPISPIPRPINPIPRPINPVLNPISIPRPISPVLNPASPIPRPISPVLNSISIPRTINPTLNPINIPRPISPVPRLINPVPRPISPVPRLINPVPRPISPVPRLINPVPRPISTIPRHVSILPTTTTTISNITSKKHMTCNEPSTNVINLESIICGTMVNSNNITSNCSNYGSRMAQSLIRVAATRIFANPTQSIMELPVNSIDAIKRKQGKSSVGKFGMGFFSILYWLIGHPKRKLIIKSTYQNELEICSYEATIFYDNELKLLYKPLTITNPIFGTVITLDASNDQFTDFEFNEFDQQLHRLSDIDDVSIKLTLKFGDVTEDQLIEDEDQLDEYRTDFSNEYEEVMLSKIVINKTIKSIEETVNIEIGFKHILVEDRAGGIPLDILFGSLLVPSISTKMIMTTNITETSDKTRISGMYPSLTITVGNIVVVIIRYKDLIIRRTPSFVVSMPLSTSLPVSRDDIILSGNTITIFKQRLNKLIDMCIDNGYNIDSLFDLLHEYAKYSGQDIIYNIIGELKQQLLNRTDLIFFPSSHDIYPILTKYINKNLKYAIISDASILKTERILTDLIPYQKDIFVAKKVVIMNGMKENFTNGGLTSFIFVNEDYTKSKDWINSIVAGYNTERLYPAGTNASKLNGEIFDLLTNKWSKESLKIYGELLQSLIMAMYAGIDNYGSVYGLDQPLRRFSIVPIANEFNINITDLPKVLEINSIYFKSEDINWILSLPKISNDDIKNLLRKQITWSYRDTIVVQYISWLQKLVGIYDESLIKQAIISIHGLFSKLRPKVAYGGSYAVIDVFEDVSMESRGLLFGSLLPYPYDSNFPLDLIKGDFIDISNPLSIQTGLETLNYAIELSSKDIEKHKFIVRHPFYYSYLTIYQLKYPKNKINSILKYILNHHNNYAEGLFFIRTIVQYILSKNINEKYINEALMNYLFQQIRQRLTLDKINTMLSKFFEPDVLELQQNTYLPLFISLDAYIAQVSNSEFIPNKTILLLPKGVNFTCKQLIEYIFEKNVDDTNLSWINNMGGRKAASTKLQTVEIAVNEGTTREFSRAILTELIQNSVDAIRLSKSKGEHISDSVKVDIFTNNDNYGISVIDYVGIPNKGILSLLIPFLSTKSVNDMISTGEMGTGFFTVYRQPFSKQVMITTDDGHRKIQIIGDPIIVNGRVIDINYNISVHPTNNVRKTEITMIMNGKPVEEIVNAYIFMYGTLPLLDQNILVNDTMIFKPEPMIQVYDTDMGTVWVSTPTSFESQLFTNGVPFAKLSDYLSALGLERRVTVGAGIKINMKRGSYTPVQSRNRIYIEPEKKEHLEKFILNGIYYAMIESINQGWLKMDDYIPFSDSEADPKQLNFSYYIDDPSRFLLTHNSYLEDTSKYALSIGVLINYIITNTEDWSKENLFVVLTHSDLIEKLPTIAVQQIIFKWFSNKPVGPKEKIINTIQDVETNINNNPLIYKFFSNFIILFWHFGQKLEQNQVIIGSSFSKSSAPKLTIENLNALGHFDSSENKIALATKYLSEHDLTSSINKLIEKYKVESESIASYIKNDTVLREYIGTTNVPKVIIHELAHAWRHQEHSASGAHDVHEMTIEGITKLYTFDDSASKVYNLILQQGLWTDLCKSMF
jgi:hypothetical protein